MGTKERAAAVTVRYYTAVNDLKREAEKRGIRVTPTMLVEVEKLATWNGITYAEAARRTLGMIERNTERENGG